MANHDRLRTVLDFYQLQFVVNLLSRRKYTMDEISDKWAMDYHSFGVAISDSKFYRILNDIESMSGIEVKREKHYRDKVQYSINPHDVPKNDYLFMWSASAFSAGHILYKHKDLHERIILDEFPSGLEYLEDICHAMHDNHKVVLRYLKYGHDHITEASLAPYYVKTACNRFYVFGVLDNGNRIYNFALDRIVEIIHLDEKFKRPKMTALEYFYDYYGIYVDAQKCPPQKVVIRAYADQPHYFEKVKLHRSQKVLRSTTEYTDFQYYVGITNDFIGAIMKQGDRLQVLEPQSLVDEIKKRFLSALSIYD